MLADFVLGLNFEFDTSAPNSVLNILLFLNKKNLETTVTQHSRNIFRYFLKCAADDKNATVLRFDLPRCSSESPDNETGSEEQAERQRLLLSNSAECLSSALVFNDDR